MIRSGRRIAGLLLIVLALAACGKKGPPVPPEVRLPAPPAGLRASIEENAILVSWTNPGTRIDGSRLKITEVRLYRREDADDGQARDPERARHRHDQIAAFASTLRMTVIHGDGRQWVAAQGSWPGIGTSMLTALDGLGWSSRRPAPPDHLPSGADATRVVQATAGNRQVTVGWSAPGKFTDAVRPQ